jgi:hypothetical protein
VQRATPHKIAKRRKNFVMLPMVWYERLAGSSVSGSTILVALHLLHLHWKGAKGESVVKLPNGMLRYDGVSRQSKWRALAELERLGLVEVERRPSRSPLIHLLHI